MKAVEGTNLKGVVFGSPEYVRKAKYGESVGRKDEIIDEISNLNEELWDTDGDLTFEQNRVLQSIYEGLMEED